MTSSNTAMILVSNTKSYLSCIHYIHRLQKRGKDTDLGIVSNIESSCSSCRTITVTPVVPSKFKGKKLQGEHGFCKKYNWYKLTLKLVLETMVSGIVPSTMAQLLSFMDLPNCQNLNSRFFKNMELTISLTLRKIAIE